jgi:uncharacterized protein
LRIVFDTNVLFSAFVSHGACAGLYEECLLGEQIVVSPDILSELREKLLAKARLSEEETREVIEAVMSDADVMSTTPLQAPICRDPDDDMVLAAALSAGADAIVTGDNDLLVLKQFQGIPILTPRDCLALIRGGGA